MRFFCGITDVFLPTAPFCHPNTPNSLTPVHSTSPPSHTQQREAPFLSTDKVMHSARIYTFTQREFIRASSAYVFKHSPSPPTRTHHHLSVAPIRTALLRPSRPTNCPRCMSSRNGGNSSIATCLKGWCCPHQLPSGFTVSMKGPSFQWKVFQSSGWAGSNEVKSGRRYCTTGRSRAFIPSTIIWAIS